MEDHPSRDNTESALRSLQEVVRENLKSGRKPNIPAFAEAIIGQAIADVVGNKNSAFVSVIPSHAPDLEATLSESIRIVAQELERSGILSFLTHDELVPLQHFIEIMLCEHEMIRAIENLPDKKLPQLTAYHHADFLRRFLYDDTFVMRELDIDAEAVKEFTPSMRTHFAVNNISDPVKGLKEWILGKISCPFNLSELKRTSALLFLNKKRA